MNDINTLLPLPVTDAAGNLANPGWRIDEPEVGSVVLINGLTGTAYQRFASGGWHGTAGQAAGWAQILEMRNVFMVYSAPARPRVDLSQPDPRTDAINEYLASGKGLET